jgi:hypothetical protein
MVIGVENGYQIPDQAIVPDLDAVSCHDRGADVDEHTLAEHKRGIPGSAQLDWYSLAAQK